MKMEMEKVTIEITPSGYTEKVEIEGKVYLREAIMTSAGASTAVGKEDWFDLLGSVDEDLAEAMDDLSFGPFGIAGVLFSRAES